MWILLILFFFRLDISALGINKADFFLGFWNFFNFRGENLQDRAEQKGVFYPSLEPTGRLPSFSTPTPINIGISEF